MDQHRRRGGSGKQSYTQKTGTGSSVTGRSGGPTPSAVSRVFGIGELLTSVLENLTPLELAHVREVSRSWSNAATGACIKKEGVGYRSRGLSLLSGQQPVDTGFRNVSHFVIAHCAL
jgi:hypothetical protein